MQRWPLCQQALLLLSYSLSCQTIIPPRPRRRWLTATKPTHRTITVVVVENDADAISTDYELTE